MTPPANPAVSRNARALGRALQQDLALGRRLLSLVNAQAEALRGNDIARMQSLEGEIQALLTRQQAADTPRLQAVRALAHALDMPGTPEDPAPSLAQILLRAPMSEVHSLLALRAEILEVEEALQAAGARNRALLANALAFVRFSLAALTGAGLRTPRYGGAPASAATFYVNQQC